MMKVILLFLSILISVNANTHIVYQSNLSPGNVFQKYGRCTTGSKNGEESVEIEAVDNKYFKCSLVASSLDDELVECDQIPLQVNTCDICSFLKNTCDRTYYGKWTLDGSEQICVKC